MGVGRKKHRHDPILTVSRFGGACHSKRGQVRGEVLEGRRKAEDERGLPSSQNSSLGNFDVPEVPPTELVPGSMLPDTFETFAWHRVFGGPCHGKPLAPPPARCGSSRYRITVPPAKTGYSSPVLR
jgi:hypothetical protein